MSGRFRRWTGRRRYSRANYRGSRYGGRSTFRRRARGNLRAANNQTDTSDVNINLFKPVSVGCSKVLKKVLDDQGRVISFLELSEGCCALNIFDVLRKSDFYKSYANMYDQFRINRITVKINPVQWETHDQHNSTSNAAFAQRVQNEPYEINYSDHLDDDGDVVVDYSFDVGNDGVAPNFNRQLLYISPETDDIDNYNRNPHFLDPLLPIIRTRLGNENVNYDTVGQDGNPIVTRLVKMAALKQLSEDNPTANPGSDPSSCNYVLISPDESYNVQPNKELQANSVKYQYPQALTIVTAWDRTGLDKQQFQMINDCAIVDINNRIYINSNAVVRAGREVYTVNIGDEITSYSSAQTKQLLGGATFNCTRYLYPSNSQEKSVYYSTSDLTDDYDIGNDYDPYIYIGKDGQSFENNSMRLTSPLASPNVPFKPTLLIGVLGGNNIKTDLGFNLPINPNVIPYPIIVSRELIRPIKFNLEFDIGVTFRGLRKAQVV